MDDEDIKYIMTHFDVWRIKEYSKILEYIPNDVRELQEMKKSSTEKQTLKINKMINTLSKHMDLISEKIKKLKYKDADFVNKYR